jgi:hypothetical protein
MVAWLLSAHLVIDLHHHTFQNSHTPPRWLSVSMDYLVSPEAIEFLTFTTELYEELGSQRYCTEISDSNGNKDSILSLTCEKFDIPILSICGELKPDHESPIIGMWQLPLTRDKIKEHVTPLLNPYADLCLRPLFGS